MHTILICKDLFSAVGTSTIHNPAIPWRLNASSNMWHADIMILANHTN